jgi:hypothetical protein
LYASPAGTTGIFSGGASEQAPIDSSAAPPSAHNLLLGIENANLCTAADTVGRI